jgi:hypothetical protein
MRRENIVISGEDASVYVHDKTTMKSNDGNRFNDLQELVVYRQLHLEFGVSLSYKEVVDLSLY